MLYILGVAFNLHLALKLGVIDAKTNSNTLDLIFTFSVWAQVLFKVDVSKKDARKASLVSHCR